MVLRLALMPDSSRKKSTKPKAPVRATHHGVVVHKADALNDSEIALMCNRLRELCRDENWRTPITLTLNGAPQ